MLGWTSLETVQSVHGWLEGGALFFFAALVVFELLAHRKTENGKRFEKIGLACFTVAIFMEVVAYPYGRRNDELASLRIAELNERASANEKEAASLRKLAQDESLARLQLEAELAWRRISKDSQSAIADHLVRLPWQMAQISYNPADLEAQSFASDIASALRGAKWEAFEPQAIANMHQVLVTLKTDTPLETGTTVTSTKNRTSRVAASGLVHELSALGFDATLSPTRFQQSTSTVFIFVGRRPDGVQGEFKLSGQKKPAQETASSQ
jgi:hypothetical protein